MSTHEGKIVRMANRYPGPPTIAVNTVGQGLARCLNLCFVCTRFKPNQPEHCRIAQELFDFSNANAIGGPIIRCAHFDPKIGVEVSDSGAYQ